MARTTEPKKPRAKPQAPVARTSKAAPAKAKAKPAAKPAAKPKAAKPRARKAAPAKSARSADTAPAAPPATGPWSLALPPAVMPGFAHGMAYPAALLHCHVPPTTPTEREALYQRFEALLAGIIDPHPLEPFADPTQGEDREATAQWFAALAGRLQRLANLPVYAEAQVTARWSGSLLFQIPTLARGGQPTLELLGLVCAVFARDGAGDDMVELAKQARTAFRTLRTSALTTSNTPRLVKAAVDNDIAFQELAGSMVLYGIGRKSALMDSTFTQECSNIGARLAKLKQIGAAFLRRAGLPAPANGVAADEERAVELAHQLGYPVVVKPADKDGGIAVQADLRTDEEVRSAYQAARKVSPSVLVEKFYQGRDYRILVFRGKALWAKERQPAGVTGDGSATIRELVDTLNADPRRGKDVYAALKRVVLDDEIAALLARDGLDFDSVPAKDEFIRLRRRANVSSGGMPIPVMGRMHPDNARLAERAADVIGLDLAGVDLIIPDIATSWRETEAAICEVNAQPELGGDAEHLYPLVLKTLVGGDGRIPTIAVLGGAKADEVSRDLVRGLGVQGLCVGNHDRTGVYAAGEALLEGRVNGLRAGRMLTMDRRLDAIVLGALNPEVLRNGLPVKHIDLLLLTGDTPPETKAPAGARARVFAEMLKLVLPHARTVIALEPASAFDPEMREAVQRTAKLNRVIAPEHRTKFLADLAKRIAAPGKR